MLFSVYILNSSSLRRKYCVYSSAITGSFRNFYNSGWICDFSCWSCHFSSCNYDISSWKCHISCCNCDISCCDCHFSSWNCHTSCCNCDISCCNCHFSSSDCHFPSCNCDFFCWSCDFSCWSCHFSCWSCHFSCWSCHFSSCNCHFSDRNCTKVFFQSPGIYSIHLAIMPLYCSFFCAGRVYGLLSYVFPVQFTECFTIKYS
jgi:hypothetical protein